MKKLYILAFALSGLITNYSAQTTYTWTGATSSDFFDPTNWLPTSGSPSSGDNALFNTGSAACTITGPISVRSFSLMSGYSGVVDMGSNGHVLTGNLTVESGTLISTSGILEMDLASGSSGFSLGAGGTYSNNAGSLDLYVNAGTTFAFSGNIDLNTLNIFFIGGTTTSRIIDFGTNLELDNIIFNGTGARVYTFQGTVHVKNTLDLGNSSHTTTLSTNNANFIFDGSSASLIGSTSTGAGKAYLPNIEINTTGNYSITRSLNVLGNWTGTQGTLTIGTSTVNMYGTSAAINGTAAAFDNLVIQTGAAVSMPANAEVKIAGTLTRTGALTFQSTTVLGLNGSGAQTISGTAITLGGIRAYSGSRTITISTPLNILDFLQVDNNVTFASGGNVTLKSTTARTARLGQLGTGASVTGNVVVETVIPGGSTGWTNMGVRGVTGQTIKSWDTYSASAGANGIPMTCDGCDYSQFALGGSFHSIQGYVEATDFYDTLLVASDPLTPGKGFWVYVGDGQFSTSDLTLINTGPLVQGPVTVSTTVAGSGANAGWNLVANPYPSPISWDAVWNSGFNGIAFGGEIQAFNPDFGYVSYSQGSGLGNPGAPTGIDDVIAGGQGFYVHNENSGITDNLEFDESVKVSNNTSANPLLKPAAPADLKYFRLKLAGASDLDITTFAINQQSTIYFDRKYDARKMFRTPGYLGYEGPYTKYTTISSRDAMNEDYSINSLPPLTQSLSVPILAKVSASGTYTISAFDFKDFSSCLGLVDKLNNSYHDLQTPYVFTISDTTSSPRFDLILCRDEAVNPTGISQSEAWSNILISQDQTGTFVKTQFAQNTKAVISAYNLLGQKLINDVMVDGTNNTTHLDLNVHNQVVIVNVTTDKESKTKKIMVH